ncbi:MAG TPA: hypothetical protein VK590_13395 [Saprospiraceae bacterium]|nr:hypothetical protein [Saprospiraceae bacterium]
MAKDPAVLWYWNDWNSGTSTLSRFLKGCYMDLLHAQFNSGPLSLEEVKTVLAADFGAAWPTLLKKFSKNPDGLFFNERAEAEKNKRKAFTESRISNLKNKKSKHMDKHMGNDMITHMDNENRNTIPKDIVIKNGEGQKAKFLIGLEPQIVKPSEWLIDNAGITISNMQLKYQFTIDQWDELYFKFDLEKSDLTFQDENNLKNSFKKFCELRSKELSGLIQHNHNGTPKSNIEKLANF